MRRDLLDHLLCVISRLTNHVNKFKFRHCGRMISCLSKLLLVKTTKGSDAGLNKADVDRLAGEPEASDHASKDVVVHVDVFEVREEIL